MIYNNNEQILLAEQSQLLTEGFTINKNPPADFYKIALDIVSKISKEVGELPAENLFNKGRKMSEIKAFSKATDRAIQGIEFNKKYKKRTKFSVSLPIHSLSLGEDSGSKELFDAIGKPIANNGFRAMNESKKFLKKLFQTIYLYRTLSDKSFMVMTYSVTYMTNYGVFAGWSTIKLAFKAVVNDEKSLRALNIMEAGNIDDAIIWKYTTPISDKAISDFEDNFGMKIPSDLRRCIKYNNNGTPNKNLLMVGNKEKVFGGLLSFNKNEDESIYGIIDTFKELDLLPFGRTPNGDYFCIKNGKVVLWDHESIDNKTYDVANSFTKFLSILYTDNKHESAIFESIEFI